MKCKNPYVTGDRAFGCGQCFPCRFNRRRIWTHRILLEARQYEDNSFLTLTYDDEHLPSDGSLVPDDLTLFLKRLRKRIAPHRIRYFAVGEYGDLSWRPHYHVAAFGYPACRFGVSRYTKTRQYCCAVCDVVRRSWPLGNSYVGTLEDRSAQYVAGYVVKKLTSKDDEKLVGRHPEFARMSNRPGIGYDALEAVATELARYCLVDNPDVDVPTALRHGSKLFPLGRYLARNLRIKVGRDGLMPAAAVEELTREVREVFASTEGAPAGFREFAFKNKLCDLGESASASAEARARIFKKRSSL